MKLSEKQPLISFVVPVYNAASTLERCVRSIETQKFVEIEIILVNNGSSDGSLDLCRKFASANSRVKSFNITKKGVSAARNKGICEATGKYIAFIDADDWIDNDVCDVFVKKNKEYDYDLFCYSARYHKKSKIVETFLFPENVDLCSEEQKKEILLKIFAPNAPCFRYKTNTRFIGSVWGKFYKLEILKNNSLFFAEETPISEDCLFNILAFEHFDKIGYTRDCFYNYVLQDDSAQNRFRPNSAKYFSYIIRNVQSWLENTHKEKLFVDAANSLFVHYLFGVLKEDLFHKDNSFLYLEQKRELKRVLSVSEFSLPLKNAPLEYFSFLEKILIWLLRKKLIKIISIAFKLVS